MFNWLRERRRQRARDRKFEEAASAADRQVIEAGGKSHSHRKFALLIGPTNSAGQASLWAHASTRAGFPAQSLRISNDPSAEWFDADIEVPRLEWTTLEGRLQLAKTIATDFEAVLIESMRPLFSLHSKRDYSAMRTFEDIRLLKKARVRSAIVFHGSDIRDTAAHAQREPFSPYRVNSPELEQLQARAQEFRTAGRKAFWRGIRVFVTTPDLLLDMPRAKWLPITIDVEKFESAGALRPFLQGSSRPKVLFQPSKGWLKSADLVAPVLQKLSDEGAIELLTAEPVEHARMPEKISQADIVIDRFDGVAGVASIEALAARRIVIANIAPWAYEKSETIPPVLHATPQTLERVLRDIGRDGAQYAHDFEAGLAFAKRWHDGAESARRISRALRLSKHP